MPWPSSSRRRADPRRGDRDPASCGSSRSPTCRGGCSAAVRERDPSPPWQHTLLVAWTGMRGAVSLAAALALPLTTDAGGAFPERGTIIFLAFCVILGTLLHPGPHPAAADPAARGRRLRRGDSSARRRRRACGPPRSRWRGSTSWRRRTGCARTPPSGSAALSLPPAALRRPLHGRRRGRRVRGPRRSAYQRLLRELLDAQRAHLSSCATPARSTTTCCDASSASSTTRTRGWRSEPAQGRRCSTETACSSARRAAISERWQASGSRSTHMRAATPSAGRVSITAPRSARSRISAR